MRGGRDGDTPAASLIEVGSKLYGTTESGGGTGCGGYGCGTVYAVNPKNGTESVLYAFQGGSDGILPYASLISAGSALYGTTVSGGGSANCNGGCGTVFSIIPKSGAEKILHSFTGVGNGSQDGAHPYTGLLAVGSEFFGTTQVGGANGSGTFYSINPTTGAETVLYSFGNSNDSANPNTNLIDVSGTLYGTAQVGGTADNGTVFSINPQTGAETIVYSFRGGTDGSEPNGALVDVNGTLFGVTEYGGAYSEGTLFSLNLATGKEKVLHSFGSGNDGWGLGAGLINVGGTLYGTTEIGGSTNPNCDAIGCGIVFSYKP